MRLESARKIILTLFSRRDFSRLRGAVANDEVLFFSGPRWHMNKRNDDDDDKRKKKEEEIHNFNAPFVQKFVICVSVWSFPFIFASESIMHFIVRTKGLEAVKPDSFNDHLWMFFLLSHIGASSNEA